MKNVIKKSDFVLTPYMKSNDLRATYQILNTVAPYVLLWFLAVKSAGRATKTCGMSLGDVCVKITDGKHGDCRNEDDSGYFFLSAKDVKHDQLNYESARQITKQDFAETHRRTNLEPNDILITNSGTIGRTAIASEDERTYRTTFQKSVAILKPIKEQINSKFCRYSLMAHLNEIVGISAGTAQKNLLLRDLRAHQFYMPETVYEQKIIAAKLDEFCKETQRLEATYRKKIAALNELKQSILQKAFTGKLTADTVEKAA